MAGQHGMRYNFSRSESQETPLFERQMGSEEFVELQQMRETVDGLHQRIVNLEKINMDLERRLEDQAKQSMAVEKECMLVEQRWKAKNEELLAEIDKWKASFRQEKLKGDRLREQVHRSERELYGILQRKYELMRGPGTNRPNMPPPNAKAISGADGFTSRRGEQLPSTTSMRESDFLLAASKKESGRSKETEVLASLSDFLGF